MSTDRLSTGTSGNISVCNAEKGLMAISPLRHQHNLLPPVFIFIFNF